MPTLAQAVPADYTTPPVYSGAAVQVIHGPVSGDSQLAQVQMDGQPCNILAEDPRSVMLTPPPGTAASLHPGTWYLVPGTWYLVPGTWYLVPGTPPLIPPHLPFRRATLDPEGAGAS
jgi:hypothetical protein